MNKWTKVLLSISAVLVLIGLVLVFLVVPGFASGLPGPWIWDELSTNNRLQSAELVVSFLALAAAVVAIAAGVVEIHQVFPSQGFEFTVEKQDSDEDDVQYETRVKANNPDDGALINSYRIEMWVVDRNTGNTLPTDSIQNDAEWIQSVRQKDDGTLVRQLGWRHEKSEPWFPGTHLFSPWTKVPEKKDEMRWEIHWWTDRAKGKPVFLDADGTVNKNA
jgi:hypothetical protein